MKTVVGIDNGTQSTKVIFYDFENMEIVSEVSASYDLISYDDGTKEQKAEWWIDALIKCFSEIPHQIKKTAMAVGVSGQQHGFVPLDADGNVLYNVKLWCDTSTDEECKEIELGYGSGEKLLIESGNRILPGYTASKILWFKKTHPKTYDKLRHILLPHDYLNFFLTGNYTMEYGDASGTGLLNVRERKWDKNILRAIDPGIDIFNYLPDLLEAHQFSGILTKRAAKSLGLPEGIPVSSGGGDNMMGAIGTGTTSEGIMTMSLGTSGTLYGYSTTPIIDKTGNLAAFCSSTGGWLPLLCTMNCTVGTELTRSVFDYEIDDFDLAASKAPPGSEGIITLPFFTGERTPNLPNGRGCIVGITDTNFKKENIFRSTMEAAIFGIRSGLDSFKNLDLKPTEIRLIGGGSNSSLWRQIAADILGIPIIVPEYKEAAAFGASLQALWAYNYNNGDKTPISSITNRHVKLKVDETCNPIWANISKYNKSYKLYNQYVENLKPLFK